MAKTAPANANLENEGETKINKDKLEPLKASHEIRRLKMEGIWIYTDEDLKEALRLRAFQERRSMSDLGREILWEALMSPCELVAKLSDDELIAELERRGYRVQPRDDS